MPLVCQKGGAATGVYHSLPARSSRHQAGVIVFIPTHVDPAIVRRAAAIGSHRKEPPQQCPDLVVGAQNKAAILTPDHRIFVPLPRVRVGAWSSSKTTKPVGARGGKISRTLLQYRRKNPSSVCCVLPPPPPPPPLLLLVRGRKLTACCKSQRSNINLLIATWVCNNSGRHQGTQEFFGSSHLSSPEVASSLHHSSECRPPRSARRGCCCP
jgi:hypothetical protein